MGWLRGMPARLAHGGGVGWWLLRESPPVAHHVAVPLRTAGPRAILISPRTARRVIRSFEVSEEHGHGTISRPECPGAPGLTGATSGSIPCQSLLDGGEDHRTVAAPASRAAGRRAIPRV